MKQLISLLIIIWFSSPTVIAQEIELTETKISECLTNCSIKSEVISQEMIGEDLTFKVGAHLNCSVNTNSNVDFKLSNDTLNIIIDEYQYQSDTIVTKTENSKLIQVTSDSTILEVEIIENVQITESNTRSLCRCFFHIDLTLKKCLVQPKTILINGLLLSENYDRRTILEMEK